MSLRREERGKRKKLRQVSRCAGRTADDRANNLFLKSLQRDYMNHPFPQKLARRKILIEQNGYDDAQPIIRNQLGRNFVRYNFLRKRNWLVNWRYEPKTNGADRRVCILPNTLKMFHRLAQDLVYAQHVPADHIGDWPKRGREDQIIKILQALRSPEQWIVSADVRNCFEHANINCVYQLHLLPDRFIRWALDYRYLQFRHQREGVPSEVVQTTSSVRDDHLQERGPRNLLQGSPVSNALFAAMIDDLPNHLPRGIQAFVYCDNIILIASSYGAARQAEEYLTSYFDRHCAGPFSLTRSVQALRRGFSHLGYRISMPSIGQVSVKLSRRNEGKMRLKMDDLSVSLDRIDEWIDQSFPSISDDALGEYDEQIMHECYLRY